MVRFFALLLILFIPTTHLMAEAEIDPRLTRAVDIQKVMDLATEYLQAGRAAEAVAVLEPEILRIDGQANFLKLLRESYIAYLKDANAVQASPEKTEHVRRQLRTLDPQLNLDEIVAVETPPVKTLAPPVALAPPVKPKPVIDDPFQQVPLDRQPKGMVREPQPQPKLAPPAAEIPEGWEMLESGSFRVYHSKSAVKAAAVLKAAEQQRTATFEKWSGPIASDWSPRCDVWLYSTANEYAKATGKAVNSSGHASVGIHNGQVQKRRLDLRLDDAGLIDATLPRETAYVVVADLFPEQAPPRWADIGMSITAAAPAEVSRYMRSLPKVLQEKKLIGVGELLKMTDFPDAERITPFYVESVSLVDYLVKLKGPKAFALYLREAPRRGYEEALQRHYGIKDAKELQERWVKFALGAE